MRTTLLVVTLAIWSVPANAATITWFDTGSLTSVSDSGQFPGLTVGTPWSLQINFDPTASGTPGSLSVPGSNCNFYPMDSTTFTLGAYTYTSTGGRIWTNSDLPGFGCSPTPTGAVQFEWGVTWTQEPGAWDLNVITGLMIAGYTDAQSDGSLPTVPSPLGPGLLNFHELVGGPRILFQDSTFSPELAAAPVPEPATLGMFGIGLAYVARRRLQRARSQ